MRISTRLTRRPAGEAPAPVVVPADPRLVVDGPLDPALTAVLGALGPFRQRLWVRRIVRRTWLALAAILVAELILWTVARFIPVTWVPVAAVVIPAVGMTTGTSGGPSSTGPSTSHTHTVPERAW